jgi:uncharacterized Zn-finger protein
MNKFTGNFKANYVSHIIVHTKDLPFHCPPQDTQSCNTHPKVYIHFNKNGKGSCPYCGARYELVQ